MDNIIKGIVDGKSIRELVMDESLNAVSAHTKNPNTKETDQMPSVEHLVKLSNGKEITVMASDPSDAISKVQSQIDKGQIKESMESYLNTRLYQPTLFKQLNEEQKEVLASIFFDIGAIAAETEDDIYHRDLAQNNLMDLFGLSEPYISTEDMEIEDEEGFPIDNDDTQENSDQE